MLLDRVFAAGDAADNELRGVADGCDGDDVCAAARLGADEGEDKGEYDGKDGDANILAVL